MQGTRFDGQPLVAAPFFGMNAVLADLRLKYEPAERISASEALFLPQATGTDSRAHQICWEDCKRLRHPGPIPSFWAPWSQLWDLAFGDLAWLIMENDGKWPIYRWFTVIYLSNIVIFRGYVK